MGCPTGKRKARFLRSMTPDPTHTFMGDERILISLFGFNAVKAEIFTNYGSSVYHFR